MTAPTAALGPLAASVIRQSLIPIGVGYLLVMIALGLALIRLLRSQRGAPPGSRQPGAAPRFQRPDVDVTAAAAATQGGWPALLRHAAATVAGGYLLLVAVVVAYYYGVAHVSGDFLSSAVTGPALLLGVAVPVFAAASMLREWWRRRASPGPRADETSEDPSARR